MRPVFLGAPPARDDAQAFVRWVKDCLAEIERASNEVTEAVADDYTISNYTETRTLNAGTATATDVANVLCTFILDLQKRGTKRTE